MFVLNFKNIAELKRLRMYFQEAAWGAKFQFGPKVLIR